MPLKVYTSCSQLVDVFFTYLTFILPSLSDRPYDFKCLFLSTARVQLFQRIDARCELIVKQGLFDVREFLRLKHVRVLIMSSLLASQIYSGELFRASSFL